MARKVSFKQRVVDILEKHGYSVQYSMYHSKEDIEKHSKFERNLDANTYFTIYDENNYVICRLKGLREKTNMNAYYLSRIIEYFQMLEIPKKEEIVSELQEIS